MCIFRDWTRASADVMHIELESYNISTRPCSHSKGGLVCAYMFWSALIRIRIPPSPAILAGNQLSNGPTQHYSVLISTDQQAQHWVNWSVLSHWMLNRNEWCWTELNRAEYSISITGVIIISKNKCTKTQLPPPPPIMTPSHQCHVTMVTHGQHCLQHPEDNANTTSPTKGAQTRLTRRDGVSSDSDDIPHHHFLAF